MYHELEHVKEEEEEEERGLERVTQLVTARLKHVREHVVVFPRERGKGVVLALEVAGTAPEGVLRASTNTHVRKHVV